MRKYYKYTYTQFEQPVLSSDGGLGGTGFAANVQITNNAGTRITAAGNAYRMFDNNTSTYWEATYDRAIMKCYFIMYNPNPIKVKNLQIDFISYDWDSGANHPENTLYYSDDGVTWTILKEYGQRAGVTQTFDCSENTGYHNYYIFMIRTRGSDGGDGIRVKEIKITDATEQITVESNQSDYDFYIDIPCVIKRIKRKYYKYNYSNWNRPNLTTSGSIYNNSFAVRASNEYNTNYPAWKAVNGTSTDIYDCWLSAQATADFIFYNPIPLNVTKLTITNRPYNQGITEGNIYGSNNCDNWTLITSFTNSIVTANTSWDINLSNNINYYNYYKIDCLQKATYFIIAELGITATQRTIINGTSSNYDFYKDEEVYESINPIIRKYYKYQDILWTQPVLTADGIIGYGNFAVNVPQGVYSTYKAFYPFASDGNTAAAKTWATTGNQADYIMYNPEPLKITNIKITNRNQSNAVRAITSVYVYGSNNNTNWTELKYITNDVVAINAEWNISLSSNTNYYKYYKLACQNSDSYIGIGKIDLTAYVQRKVEGTSSNHDFYEDIQVYKGIK